jgi:hypothetical protein
MREKSVGTTNVYRHGHKCHVLSICFREVDTGILSDRAVLVIGSECYYYYYFGPSL